MSEACPHCNTFIPANLPVGFNGRCRCGVYTYCIVLHHVVPEGTYEWLIRRQQGLPTDHVGVPHWTRSSNDVDADGKKREYLTDNEYTILRALQDKHPRLVLLHDLGADTCIARKTCGRVVKSLIERGLAERESERTGATITPAGRALLDAIDASRTPLP